jgi:uridylate kinase
MGRDMPMTVFDIFTPGNLRRLLAGESVGTRIASDAVTRFAA